ncbi:MAG: hypothetical protein LBB40_00220 [Holophagales bacterium]|jgi:hypothetical protein|nr:hypothetical protein [Holophagales bacterium]
MNQPDIAVRSDTTAGALSPTFAPNQTQETPPDGFTVTCASETLIWTELSYRNQTFVLSKELVIRVTSEDGGWSFESEDYELLGFGHTRSEAELAFRFDFSLCWNEIACEDDKILSPGAKEMKRSFLELVNSVK